MRILMTRLSALGDIVHTWPLANALRDLPETTAVAWLVEEPFVALVEGHPAVDRVISVATRRWRHRPLAPATRTEIGEVRRALRTFAPDLVIDPQGLVKSALWGWVARAPRRIGFDRHTRREWLAGACYTARVGPPRALRHVVDLNLSLLTALQTSPPYGARPDGRHLLGTDAPRPPQGTFTLWPGTGGSGKGWPAQAFADLARRLTGTGRPVSVAWGPGEEDLARAVADAGGHGVTVAPRTTIRELTGYLAGSAVVVGGDTGPVHLAASLGVPTVAIFLATDPDRNGPRGDRATVVSGSLGTARRGRARTAQVGAVTVDQVLEAARSLVDQGLT